MAGITLSQAQSQLDAWLAASLDVASGKTTKMGEDLYTAEDADKIQKMIQFWNTRVSKLSRTSGGMRIRRVVPQ